MIGSNLSIPWSTNPFLLQENEKIFIFTEMILQVILKLLQILILLGASVVTFSTQKKFRSSKCDKYVFKTSLWNHSFALKSFGMSQMILLFSCSPTKSKSVIFCLLISQWRSQNLPICWILLHFLTSGASKKFSVGQNYTYWVSKRSAWIRALHR